MRHTYLKLAFEYDLSKQIAEFLKNHMNPWNESWGSHAMRHATSKVDLRMTHDTYVTQELVVEPVGIEPTTFWLQTRRSPS
jgi:uncharacterized protein CbrC (UPF0167 family)